MSGSRTRVIFYTVAAVISLAGLADATYLTVMYVTGETAVCGGSASCFQVLGSAYARIGRIPVAAFGALAYFGAFSFATFAAFGYVRNDVVAALRAGIPASRVLSLLSLFGGSNIFARRDRCCCPVVPSDNGFLTHFF
jgi:uncharacterized membrane protein